MEAWNHRVIFHDEDGPKHTYFAIHECHYHERGDKIPHSWTSEPVQVLEASTDDIRVFLTRVRKCLQKPILRISGNTLIEYFSQGKSGDAK